MDQSSRSNTVAIGINLGTKYMSASIWRNGKIEVIPNLHDQSGKTPCFISFNNTSSKIGFPALYQDDNDMNPTNTIFDTKRLFGIKYDDPKVQDGIQYWPFKLIRNGDTSEFEVASTQKLRHYSPGNIILLFLKHVKKLVKNYLGDPTVTVFNAVVAVPATFNYFQRQAIKELGDQAGLNVVRIVIDNIATAFSYKYLPPLLERNSISQQRLENDCKSYLIFDFGAGFLSVSIITLEKGFVEVISVSGDSHLGGRDFDNRLFQHIASKFIKKNLKDDPEVFVRFMEKCEETKIALSSQHEACFNFIMTGEGARLQFAYDISRPEFEELCSDLLDAALLPIMKVLASVDMKKSEIHEVILVGGSSNIPAVQTKLQDFFGGKSFIKPTDSIDTVAIGATMQAALLSGFEDPNLERLLILDATSFSLGVETTGGVMSSIIKCNTSIPTKQTHTFIANSFDADADVNFDPQSPFNTVIIKVYEGENTLVNDNNLLCTLNFKIASSESEIEVAFDIDANYILGVTVVDKRGGDNEDVGALLDGNYLLKTVNSFQELVASGSRSVRESFAPRPRSCDNNQSSAKIILARYFKGNASK